MRTISPSAASSAPLSRDGFRHDEPRIIDRLHVDAEAERRALIAGLRCTKARIAPKYFYDVLGAALYAAICEVPEYYLTRTERGIFTRHRDDIVAAVGRGTQLVDLGAGDAAKAAMWLPFIASPRYVGVDIAADTLRAALVRLAIEFPALDMVGVVTDFTQGLDLRGELGNVAATFFYPGSSIGNFTPEEARRFLTDIRAHCVSPGSGLLIGVDTPKERARLEAAYDDMLGVTAAFNRNILLHVNRVLGCDFDPAAFAHLALYDVGQARVEMHLVATRDSTVRIDAVPRRFRGGERIHTENSCKYAPGEFTQMLHQAGFETVRLWQDDAGDFAVYYAA